MGRGSSGLSSKAGGKTSKADNTKTNKSFSEMSVPEKRQKLKEYKKSLDDRFKHYEFEGYDIYNVGGTFSAHDFNVSDSIVEKMRYAADTAVLYDKTLKGIKAELGKGKKVKKK